MIGNIRVEDFLTNTAIAYTLLLIAIMVFTYIVLKTPASPKKNR